MIDLSHWDVVSDWKPVVRDHAFISLKATQGRGYSDDNFEESYNAIRAIDKEVLIIPYHFADSDCVDDEIDWFIHEFDRVIPKTDKRVWACLDFETNGLENWATEWFEKFTTRMQNTLLRGRVIQTPLIYSRANLVGIRRPTDKYTNYLWQAQYGVLSPDHPENWRRVAWQYTDSAVQEGIVGKVDFSMVNTAFAEMVGIGLRRWDIERYRP